jgi:hypothetical protein
MLGFRPVAGKTLGAMNLYARVVSGFGHAAVVAATTFALQADFVLANAQALRGCAHAQRQPHRAVPAENIKLRDIATRIVSNAALRPT